jgi:endogenous inhibitor of DNA gyrase (YacG/DUF329 family)
MKVLKEGDWNAKWELKVNCATCAAELLIEESDLTSSWDYGKETTRYYVLCPLCRKAVEIPAEKLTPRLAEKLQTRPCSTWD